MKLLIVLLILPMLALSNHISDQQIQEVETYIKNYIKANNIVGVALVLTENGEQRYSRGFGYQDAANQIPVDPKHTLFRWASMSKQVCAIVANEMINMGYLDYDSYIMRYWDDYEQPTQFIVDCLGQDTIEYKGQTYTCKDNWAFVDIKFVDPKITLRTLLSHYSGIEAYTNGLNNPTPPNSDANNPINNTGIQWATNYLRKDPLIHLPGAAYNYTSFGFNLAGVTLEKSTGMRFEDLAKAIVFERAGMASVSADKYWLNNLRPNRTKGYKNGPDNLSPEVDVSWKLPGGGWQSTVEDLGRFLNYVRSRQNDTGFQNELWQPVSKDTPYYGLGFEIFHNQGKLFYVGHSGAQDKTRTYMRHNFIHDIGIGIMSNTESTDIAAMIAAIQNIVITDTVEGVNQEKDSDVFLNK